MATTTRPRLQQPRPPLAPTTVSQDELAEALGRVEETAGELMEMDSRVHAVGVGLNENGRPIFRAVRNAKKIVVQKIAIKKLTFAAAKQFAFPVKFVDAEADATPLHKRAISAAAVSVLPEQERHRPLVCGLQIQNFDDDSRQGIFKTGGFIVGSIGCFVTKGKTTFILSNNHVLAGENRGQTGDRILQNGGIHFAKTVHVANLSAFVPIKFSPVDAAPKKGNVVFNDVDAAIAALAIAAVLEALGVTL
jgi:hypothetical protein